jgi:hypothetical protein
MQKSNSIIKHTKVSVLKAKDLRIGDNLKVIYIGGESDFFTITAIDDIFYMDSHDALTAGDTEDYAEVSDLDPPKGQLYYFYRIETECNVKIYVKQPAATNRLGTNKSPEGGFITDKIGMPISGEEVDMWVAEDYAPNVQIVNGTNTSITPILRWRGKRFAVQEIKQTPSVYTTVRIGGISE